MTVGELLVYVQRISVLVLEKTDIFKDLKDQSVT